MLYPSEKSTKRTFFFETFGGAYSASPAQHPAARNLGNYPGTKAIWWNIHTRVFYVTYTPMHPFPFIFVTILTFLRHFPPQMVHLLPVRNVESALYEL